MYYIAFCKVFNKNISGEDDTYIIQYVLKKGIAVLMLCRFCLSSIKHKACFMTLNAAFKNSSAISWRSVVIGGVSGKKPTCRKSLTNFIA